MQLARVLPTGERELGTGCSLPKFPCPDTNGWLALKRNLARLPRDQLELGREDVHVSTHPPAATVGSAVQRSPERCNLGWIQLSSSLRVLIAPGMRAHILGHVCRVRRRNVRGESDCGWSISAGLLSWVSDLIHAPPLSPAYAREQQ